MKAAAGTAALAASAAWLPKVALAKDYRSSMRDTIIWVYLRGAADGLTLCVPHADDEYYNNRPTLAIPRPDSGGTDACIDLDGFFGLAPAMSPLVPAYQDGQMLFVHACGSPDPSRSHFDAQRFMEVGKAADPFLVTGWLGRHLATVSPAMPGSILRAVGLGTGLQQVLVSGPGAIPVPDLDTFGLLGDQNTKTARTNALRDMYASVPDPLRGTAQTTLATINLLDSIDFAHYQPAGNAQYIPSDSLGYALKTSAAMIKAQVGVEAIAIDVVGWDTHSTQGVITGTMSFLMNRLASALSAFQRDMSNTPNAPGYILAVVSEFGRRLHENGSGGTDHGHGNAMMLMGQAVRGGRVLRNWPGLGYDQLFENLDLAVTIDYRDILSEIIDRRLGNQEVSSVFPGYTPTYRGVVS
jgi:hypothetical protein